MTKIREQEFRITWEPPTIAVDISKYKITLINLDSQDIMQTISNVRSDRLTYKATGLVPGTNYKIGVQASIETSSNPLVYQDSPIAELQCSTLLDAPTNLKFTSTSKGSLEFMWAAPKAPITHFVIKAMNNGKEIKSAEVSAVDVMYDENSETHYKYKLNGLQEGMECGLIIVCC